MRTGGRLIHLSPMRAALTLTIVGFLVSIPVAAVMEFFRQFDTRPTRHPGIDLLFVFALVLAITISSFVLSFFGALAFNLVSRFTKGLPYEVSTDDSENAISNGGL
jgi:hypothetical protein